MTDFSPDRLRPNRRPPNKKSKVRVSKKASPASAGDAPHEGRKVGIKVFRVQGSGFRVQGSGFRVQGSGFRV